MAEKFNPGDIVQLKSGGPKMTVTGVRKDSFDQEGKEEVHACWFSGSKLENGSFPFEALLHLDEAQKGPGEK